MNARLASALLFLALTAAAALPAQAETVIVDTVSDVVDGNTVSISALDDDPGPDGRISFREALLAANNTPGTDQVLFDNSLTGGTILVESALPIVTDPVVIDAGRRVELRGNAPGIDGLVIEAGSSTIDGLVINGFGYGIWLRDGGGNRVRRCYIGVDAFGGTAVGNTLAGIRVQSASNEIGGAGTPREGNVISGNQGGGILIVTADAQNNAVFDNSIGTDFTGTAAVPNDYGISIEGGAGNSSIGVEGSFSGSSIVAGNVISGNTRWGIRVSGSGTSNEIGGNLIGTDATGNSALPNDEGVVLLASFNSVGSFQAGEGNVISGNTSTGVRIAGGAAEGNGVRGNLIGVALSRNAPLPNDTGLLIEEGASFNGVGIQNIIAGNDGWGLEVVGTTSNNNFILGNQIGGVGDGGAPLPNGAGGVRISGATATFVGGINRDNANSISDNGDGVQPGHGVMIVDSGAATFVLDNVISGNTGDGIHASDASSVFVGVFDNTIRENHLIGNGGSGVYLGGVGAFEVRSNFIGTDEQGGSGLANGKYGVLVNESTGIVVQNVIGQNALDGIAITGASSSVEITQNSIYDNGGLGIDLADDGVTGNDGGDEDDGPNALQNFPVLTDAVVEAGGLRIEGSLDAQPTGIYRLEFFATATADPSGNGEGKTYLGEVFVSPGGGPTPFVAPLGSTASVGDVITATVRDPNNRTSEFSDALVVTDPTPALAFNWNGDGDNMSHDDPANWEDGNGNPGVPGPNDDWEAGTGATITVAQGESWQTDEGRLIGDASVVIGGRLTTDVLDQFSNSSVTANGALITILEEWNMTGGTARLENGASAEGGGLWNMGDMEIDFTGNTIDLDVNVGNTDISGAPGSELTVTGSASLGAGTRLLSDDPTGGLSSVSFSGPTTIDGNIDIGESVEVSLNGDATQRANVRANGDGGTLNVGGTLTVEGTRTTTVYYEFDDDGNLVVLSNDALTLGKGGDLGDGATQVDGTLTLLRPSGDDAVFDATGALITGDGVLDVRAPVQVDNATAFNPGLTVRVNGSDASVDLVGAGSATLPRVEPVGQGGTISGGDPLHPPEDPNFIIQIYRSSVDAGLTFRSGTFLLSDGEIDAGTSSGDLFIAQDANVLIGSFQVDAPFFDFDKPVGEPGGTLAVPKDGALVLGDDTSVDFRVFVEAERDGLDNGTFVLGDNTTANLFAGANFQGGERQVVAGDGALLNVQGSLTAPSDVNLSTTPTTDTPQDDATIRIGPFGSVRFSDLSNDLITDLDGGTIQPSGTVTYTDRFIYNGGDNLAPANFNGGGVANGPMGFLVEKDIRIGGTSTFSTDLEVAPLVSVTLEDGSEFTFFAFDINLSGGRVTGEGMAAEERLQRRSLVGGPEGAARGTSGSAAFVIEAGARFRKAGSGTGNVFVPVTNAGSLLVEEGTLAIRNALDGTGLLGGDGTIDVSNGTVTVEGPVSPGDSTGLPGILSWAGDFTPASSASLDVELGGLTPGTEHDQLAVDGDATLGGTLRLRHLLGFFPPVGDSFTVLTATGTVTGTFDAVEAPNGYTYAVAYNATNVVVTVTSRPSFDLQAINTNALTVAPGGSVAFDYAIRNSTGSAATGDLWFTASPGGLSGVIRSGALPGGATVTGSYVQPVPGSAPPGTYTYRLNIGQFPSPVVDQETFSLTVASALQPVVVAKQEGDEPNGWTVTEAAGWGTSPTGASAEPATDGIKATASVGLPETFALHGAYPNPFVRQTTLRYDLPEASAVRIEVYDVLGREVARLVDGGVEAGRHGAVLEGSALASGVYVIRLVAADRVFTQRVTLVR